MHTYNIRCACGIICTENIISFEFIDYNNSSKRIIKVAYTAKCKANKSELI